MSFTKTTGARGALAAVLLVLVGGCHGGEVSPMSPDRGAGVALTASLQEAALAAQVVRMTLAVSAPADPAFQPVGADLVKAEGVWSAFLTGVSAGPARRFEVSALDGSGLVLASGGGTSDVKAGTVTHLVITLTRQGGALENQAPVIDYLSASATEVEAGASVTVGVSAHDPDPADQVDYRWSASCGRFDDQARTDAVWTAPGAPGTCRLTITVSDGRIGISDTIDVRIRGGRSVAGSRLATHWPDPPAGRVTLPAPDTTSSLPPQVLVRGAAGAWNVLPGGHRGADGAFLEGSYGPDGAFEVPGVPAGGYTLCLRPAGAEVLCLDGTDDQVDLGYDVLGRADQALPTAATPVTFDFEGLDPWNPILERIEITSSGANLFDAIASGADLRGGQVSSRIVENWNGANGSGAAMNLLAATDLLHIHQLSARSFYTDGVMHLYGAASHAATLPSGLALSSGQAVLVAAHLAQLPLTASLAVDWDPAPFEAQLALVGPASRTTLGAAPHLLTVGASAFELTSPAPAGAGAPSLVSLALPAGTGRVAGGVWYGRFLPDHWREWRAVRSEAGVAYLAPGATMPWVERAGIERREPLPVAAGPVRPVLSPVSRPLIGGADALQDQSGVGEAPTLSWTAPGLGEPTGYLVEICRLEAVGGQTRRSLVLRYATAARQVTVPPGILVSGATYFARITAEIGSAPASAPLRGANTGARAAALTGTFTP